MDSITHLETPTIFDQHRKTFNFNANSTQQEFVNTSSISPFNTNNNTMDKDYKDYMDGQQFKIVKRMSKVKQEPISNTTAFIK